MSRYDEQLAELRAFGETLTQPLEPGSQGSADWFRQRVGKCTASRFAEATQFLKKGGEGAKRYNYRMELVVERLTGEPSEHYVSKYMEWGSEQEGAARMAYEARSGCLVVVPGFIDHPTIAMCGGSPDGLIDDDGLLEMKAPTSVTHLETILAAECEHLPQIQGNLWVTGRKWADFVSYDPRMPKHLQLHVQRIARDEEYIAKLAADVRDFLGTVQEVLDQLKEKQA